MSWIPILARGLAMGGEVCVCVCFFEARPCFAHEHEAIAHDCPLVAAGKRHLSQPPKVSGTVPAGLTSKPQRPVASIMLQHPRGKLQSTPRKSLPERCASPRWSTESTAEGVLHRTSRTQSWTTATFGLKGGAHSHVHWQSSPKWALNRRPSLDTIETTERR